ncbi:MAG: ABC transporter permease [Planctomycetes bacterium]|nr:ABC transporter permease [Planctomycetota bacterium]
MNPVAWKDLLTYARGLQQGSAGVRFVGTTVVLGAPLLAYAWCVVSLPGGWGRAAPAVFLVVAGIMALFGLSVAVPAATAFALERDRETLEGLVVSPLGPWQLVLGKLQAAVTIGAITHAALLPLLAVAYVLGGGDLAFVPAWLLLLLATNVSFAAFCLVAGARRLDAPSKLGWVRAQSTQAQMALQGTLGVGVLLALVPIYAVLLLPFAAAQGAPVGPILDAAAPFGALHPLVALAVWGEARVLGAPVPVWLIGVVVHLLLALPLLSDAVEAQRSEGSPPGRLTRALCLPLVAALLVLAAATGAALPDPGRVVVAVGAPAVLLLAAAARTGFVPAAGARRVERRRVLAGLARPDLALESAPDRAPGFVALLALACAPLVVWGAGAEGLATLAALALMSVALAAVGARLVARGQEQEDRAFEAAARAGAAPAPEPAEAPRPPRGRFFLRLALASLLLPPVGAAGLSFGQGAAPALGPLAPVFTALCAAGLALNPFAALLPTLADPHALGTDAPRRVFAALGLEPEVVLGLHVACYAVALLAAVASIRRPLDVAAALAAAGVGAPEAPPPDAPATDRPAG